MTEKIQITIRFDKAKEDFQKLRRINDEMSNFEVRTKDETEARRLWVEEYRRRLKSAGLSK